MKFKSLSLLPALCAAFIAISAHAGTKPATMGGSASMVGNIFVPVSINQNVIPVVSTGTNAVTLAPVVINAVAPSQGTYAVISPAAVQTLGVMFGLTPPGPNSAAAVNNFSSNMTNIMPALNSVNVNLGSGSAPVNLGQSIQASLSVPSLTSVLSALQLTIIAIQQNPGNPAVVQLAQQLIGTYKVVSN